MARPTDYKTNYNAQAYKLCLLGATDVEIADFFEVNVDTIYEWKKVYVKFSEAIKKGKSKADSEVADKLFKRATGYSHPDVDIQMFKGEIITTKLTKHYPPDTTAAIFWLKNRSKQYWRDKVETGITDGDGKDVALVKIIQLPNNNRNRDNHDPAGSAIELPGT